MVRGIARFAVACGVGTGAWLGSGLSAEAVIIKTTNAGDVAAFSAGMLVEHFEPGLNGAALGSYDPNQPVAPDTHFSSRDSATSPTFHSGGASLRPGHNPDAHLHRPAERRFRRSVSSPNVAAPCDLATELPWNFGFMVVIVFPGIVARVGFWVTHGTVDLNLRDRQGNGLATCDATVTGTAGSSSISRGASDIAVAAITLSAAATPSPSTTSCTPSPPEPSGPAPPRGGRARAGGGVRAAPADPTHRRPTRPPARARGRRA
jgi:hypothetical protein